MSISIYQASIVSLGRALENLKNVLAKGARHAEANKIDPMVLTHARLFPDMLPLFKQVHIATSLSGRCVARLAGQELPDYRDTEESFSDLIERVDKTLAYIRPIQPEQVDTAGEKEIEYQAGGGRTRKRTGRDYLLEFILPNVYFHITTTYDILRHCGVSLGKKDYIGDL
jgi:hypothetical protein